jgi:uncharacterized repeat protein (TIGR03803 family)
MQVDMKDEKCRCLLSAALTLAVLTLPFARMQAADKEDILYNFSFNKDGAYPVSGLIRDSAGNLYGTTEYGGNLNDCVTNNDTSCGVIFELTPKGDGSWKETPLHAFNGGDGAYPNGKLTWDSQGNLYGTTYQGGNLSVCENGCGVVFRLSPGSDGKWKETVLHRFTGQDGYLPQAGLIIDSRGNLFGTTQFGGSLGYGTVFEVSPASNDTWKEKVLHSFTGNDGQEPLASLIFDAAGNLYGTAASGGGKSGQTGTVFELTPTSGDRWKERVLHTFSELKPNGGFFPATELIFDAEGNLYGTTFEGGAADKGAGLIFELSHNSNGTWTEKVLHSFNSKDGYNPSSGLVFDSSGNLYGTTSGGGSSNDGVLFELRQTSEGVWKEIVLHTFTGLKDGVDPSGTPLFDPAGNLYGTAFAGGSQGRGVVFEVTP